MPGFGRIVALAACAGLAGLIAPAGPALAQLAQYDCSAVMGSAPVNAIRHYRGGQVLGFDMYQTGSGALQCLRQTQPEARWLSKTDASGVLAEMAKAASAPQEMALGQRYVTAAGDLRLARPKPLPKAIGPAPGSAPSAPASAAPMALDNAREPLPQVLMQEQALAQANGDTRVQVQDTTAFPYRTVAFIAATYPSGNVFSCTATLVTPYVALTAGHCVYDVSEGGYATRIRVSPALNQSPAFTGTVTFPYGNRLADAFQTTTQWQNEPSGSQHPNSDYVYDVAALLFKAPFPSFTASASFLPLAFNQSPSAVTNDGYPGTVQGQSGNEAQWIDTESVYSSGDSNLDANLLTTNIYSSPGDSGSPFWTPLNNALYMVGSLSAGPGSGPGAIGPKYGPLVQSLVSNWVGTVPPNQPESGWWWNTNSPGRGFAMETSASTGNVFFAAFQYDGSGNDQWTVATLQPTGTSGVFSGALTLYRNASMSQTLGTLTLTLTNPVQGVLTWPAAVGGGSTTIGRFPLDPSGGGMLFAPNYGYTAQRGWWWDPTHPGSGYQIEIQNNTLFFGAFIYRTDGTAMWVTSLNQMSSTTAFNGSLNEYHGGASYAQTGGSPASSNVGTVGIQFNSDNKTATLTLNGQAINIQRFTSF